MPNHSQLNIALAVPQGNLVIASFAGALNLFERANQYLAMHGQGTGVFSVRTIGVTTEKSKYDKYFAITPEFSYRDTIDDIDLVLVPAVQGDPRDNIAQNQPLINWLKSVRKSPRVEFLSLCTGAFILGAAGILDGRTCTTHWIDTEKLQQHFPKSRVTADRIITDDRGCYTSGGAFSGLNLILYYIRKKTREEVAVWLSKLFEIDLGRTSQAHFVMFDQHPVHDDPLIADCQEFILTHLDEKMTIASLSARFGFSTRNFIRRFKKATGTTPNEYMQRVRIEQAKRLLESTDKRVYEILMDVGYHDSKTFRETFRKITGLSPKMYRDKYIQSA